MKHNSSIVYALFLVLGDFLALIGAFVVAYILRVKYDTRPLLEQIPSEAYLYGFLAVLPLWILVHGFIGLYRREIYENRFKEFGRLFVGSLLGMLVVIGYDFIIDGTLFPARLVAVYGFVLSFSFLVIFRIIARLIRSLFFSFGYGIANVLLVGNDATTSSILYELENTKKSGHRIIGIVTDERSKHPTFSTFTEAVEKIGARKINVIIQTELYRRAELNDEVMGYAQSHHISYKFIPGNNELFVGNIEVELFRGTPVVTVHQTALMGWGSVVKRLFDLAVGLILLLIVSPILLLVALLQKITYPRAPVLLKQTRLTQFNRKFTVYKFRSFKPEFNGMSPEDAFKKMGKPELAKAYREGGDQIPDDPRITRLGKLLRITSIDELPQLLNVVRGDISLVGPRALVPEELKNYKQRHNILSIKSGVTGLAQVSGRRDISFEDRRKLDLYYVQNWSFWLDIIILLRTFRAVINGIGAK